jgi:hypothetical protein
MHAFSFSSVSAEAVVLAAAEVVVLVSRSDGGISRFVLLTGVVLSVVATCAGDER